MSTRRRINTVPRWAEDDPSAMHGPELTEAEARRENPPIDIAPRCRCGAPLARRGDWTLTTCAACEPGNAA